MKYMKSRWILVLSISMVAVAIFLAAESTKAENYQRRGRRSTPAESSRRFTYDLGASTGTYNSYSYSEITIGLNYYLTNFLIWRNALFTRMGSGIDSASGLDTSARFFFDSQGGPGDFGFALFAGPGYRISNEKNSAFFAEGGAILKLGGLNIGGGVKSMIYSNPGKDSRGNDLPKSDNILFIILGGGGSF
jgi:hypothetical protein